MILLATSGSTHAVSMIGFSPAIPQAHQPIFSNVALLGTEDVEGFRVFRQGNNVDLVLLFNDVVDPDPPPPLQDRTESYAIGALPAGNYQLRLYISAPGYVLVQTVPLGVAAATPVPALGGWSVLLLCAVVGSLGCAMAGTLQSRR